MKQIEKITGVLVDVNTGTIKETTIEASLDNYYSVLDCRCIDITTRFLGPYQFDIICDDEGLLTANPRVSAVDPYGDPALVGNLFFCHHDEEGRLTSLLPGEADFILSRAYPVRSRHTGECWKAIFRLSYKPHERV